jgi:VWFA-related protein
MAKPQKESAPYPGQEDVVKLGVTLVQVDAVVMDKAGRYVTDLTADDFEIYEDGRRQKITNFSYVAAQPKRPGGAAGARSVPLDKNALPVPPARLRPEQIRRTMALVVDDLELSAESVHFVRQSLKKFVDEQMQPEDIVAIIRTGGGRGFLQQFTSDKRQLYAAIERVRWNPSGRGGLSAVSPIIADDPATAGSSDHGNANRSDERADARSNTDVNQLRNEVFSVGTIATLNAISRGIKDFPGRKSVILFSDGMTIFSRSGDDNVRILEALRRLVDQANRASVVFYTIDSRGLQTLLPSAADDLKGRTQHSFEEPMRKGRENYYYSQEGLIYLAKQTGGLSFLNSNDLSKGIARVLDDQQGYYLIGYTPEESTFKAINGRRAYHNLSMKVRRAGLMVRYRTGFYGVPDTETPALAATPVQQLHNAIASPFSASGIPLQLTSMFGYEDGQGLFMNSMLHIDISKLTFSDAANDTKLATIDVGAVTFKDTGAVIDQVWKNYTITISAKTFAGEINRGLVYTILLPIKNAGAYQLRTVVRDSQSARIGSANQFIEVPDVDKGRFAISGIMAQGVSFQEAQPDQQKQAIAGQNRSPNDDSQHGPALRRIKSGSLMDYGFWIYNARLDKDSNLPQLEAQVFVYQDGKMIFAGKGKPVEVGGTQNLKSILAGGSLNFSNFEPGEYVLQVVVTDKLAKEKSGKASQWIDFEVVK